MRDNFIVRELFKNANPLNKDDSLGVGKIIPDETRTKHTAATVCWMLVTYILRFLCVKPE